MKKKMVALLVASATLATVLAGCGSKPAAAPAAPAAEEKKEEAPAKEEAKEEAPAEEAGSDLAPVAGTSITFMHDWPEYTAEFEGMAERFEAETGIHVDINIITWDVLTKTVTTQFANNELPDVWCSWSNQMGQFNYMGMVYDLNPYLDENGGEWRDSLLKPAVDLGSVAGHCYAIPYRTTQTVLAVNTTILDANGWSIPTTVEELEALCQDVVDSGIGVWPILAPGTPNGFQMAAICSTFAEQQLYDEGTLQSQEWLSGHSSNCADAYAYGGTKLKEWMEKGYIVDSALALAREEAQAMFFTQKGLFSFLNNNELLVVEEGSAEAGFEVDFLAFPQPEHQTELFLYNFGVDSFSVASTTQHPNEAAAWLKFITSDEEQSLFGNSTRSIMGNKNVKYDDPNQNKLSDIFSKASSYRINYDYNAGNLGTEIGDEISAFAADPNYTPEQLGEKVAKMRQDCIDENAN